MRIPSKAPGSMWRIKLLSKLRITRPSSSSSAGAAEVKLKSLVLIEVILLFANLSWLQSNSCHWLNSAVDWLYLLNYCATSTRWHRGIKTKISGIFCSLFSSSVSLRINEPSNQQASGAHMPRPPRPHVTKHQLFLRQLPEAIGRNQVK